MVRCFAAYGLHRGDIIQNSYGYGLFTGGLGAHYGAEALGATVIPTSGGNTDRQIMVLQDFGVTAICCTPSYFLHLLERAAEIGVELRDLPLRAGIFGAEPWNRGPRQRIQEQSGIELRYYGCRRFWVPASDSNAIARPAAPDRGPLLPRDRRSRDG